MNENVYEKLGVRLNKFDQKKSLGDAFFEILKKMYTPEEAEVAANFPEGSHSVKELTLMLNKEEDDLTGLLEKMAYKGTIFSYKFEDGKRVYELMPYVPGAIEYYVLRHLDHPDEIKKVLELNRKMAAGDFAHLKKLIDENPKAEIPPPGFRTVAVNEAILGKKEVFPFENILEMIETQSSLAAMPCTCREGIAPNLGSGQCKVKAAPEYCCFTFGKTAEYLIEQKFAKRITKEECVETLKLCNKAGLVQNVNNFTDDLQFICNCCSCCCMILSTVAMLGPIVGVAPYINKSNFAPVIDAENCIGCQNCEERCPVNAISLIENVAIVNRAMCIGCSQCMIDCPVDCISMDRISNNRVELGSRKIGFGF
jgi:Na+-translocating ferredoxin:NAD+ oxidoreductase subunit B